MCGEGAVLGDFLTFTDYKTIMTTTLPWEKKRNYNTSDPQLYLGKVALQFRFR